MPQFEFALGTAKASAKKVQLIGQSWGMCGQHRNNVVVLQNLMVEASNPLIVSAPCAMDAAAPIHQFPGSGLHEHYLWVWVRLNDCRGTMQL